MTVITYITRISLFTLTKSFIVLYNGTHPFIVKGTEQQEGYTKHMVSHYVAARL
jgi:hypothetical protein